MGLRNIIQNAVKTAFNAVGDIPVLVIYHHTLWGEYDPVTGSRPDTGDDETVEIILSDFHRMELPPNDAQPGDKKGLIRQATLTLGDPDFDDYLIISGVTWHIVGFESDPADATWILQLRRA